MEGLQSFAGVQHSEDEPQERLGELAGGERPLETKTLWFWSVSVQGDQTEAD